MLGIIIIPVKVEESWWASQRKWHWSKPLKDGEEVDKWYCGEPACRPENSTSKGMWKLVLIPWVAQIGWAQRLWKRIGEDEIRKCRANLSLVFDLWTVDSHGRYWEAVINSVTIILLIFCISS